jgi:hypothetical protein
MVRHAPTHEELQAVVGRALVDPSFSKDLLNGHRAERLAEFNLSTDELSVARRISANDLAGFAGQLDAWINAQARRRRTLAAVSQFEAASHFESHFETLRPAASLPAAA